MLRIQQSSSKKLSIQILAYARLECAVNVYIRRFVRPMCIIMEGEWIERVTLPTDASVELQGVPLVTHSQKPVAEHLKKPVISTQHPDRHHRMYPKKMQKIVGGVLSPTVENRQVVGERIDNRLLGIVLHLQLLVAPLI